MRQSDQCDLYRWELVRAYRKYVADTRWCPSPGVAQLIKATEDHEGVPTLTSKQTRRGSEKRTPRCKPSKESKGKVHGLRGLSSRLSAWPTASQPRVPPDRKQDCFLTRKWVVAKQSFEPLRNGYLGALRGKVLRVTHSQGKWYYGFRAGNPRKKGWFQRRFTMPWTSMPIAEQPITTHHRRVDCNEGPTSHQESEAIGLVGAEELAPGSICGPEPSSVCAQCHKLREPEEPNYSGGHSAPILCEACYRGGTSSSCPSRPSDDSKATESRKSRPQERGKASSEQVGPVSDGCRVYPRQHWCEVWRRRASRSTVWTQCRKETDLNCWHCMRYVCATHLGFPTVLCSDCYLSLGRD